MPAGQGKDAERFAAAVESRTPLGPADDGDLAALLDELEQLSDDEAHARLDGAQE